MTNPNNAIGTNAAYSGRTSVNAFNDDLSAYTTGVLSGWACEPDSGMIVSLGGDGNTRDVAIAEDNSGNKTTINNISGSPVNVTLGTAPGSNSRIDAIVAYVDNPPQGVSNVADNPSACGIIAVAGTPSASPEAPNDSAIRTAITADGASGTTAYYVVLATVTVPTGTTDLIPGYIQQGVQATTANISIPDGSITADKLDFTTYSTSTEIACGTWIDGKTIYKKTVNTGALPNASIKTVAHGITGINRIIKMEGYAYRSSSNTLWVDLNWPSVATAASSIAIGADLTNISVFTGADRTTFTESYVTLYYTKTS